MYLFPFKVVSKAAIILLVTIAIPLILTYWIYIIAYNLSSYQKVAERMVKRKPKALLLIEIDDNKKKKILFRLKSGLHTLRDEYRYTWVLPGGEVELNEAFTDKVQEIPKNAFHQWAEIYAQKQIGITVKCKTESIDHPFFALHAGGISMGYAPGEIYIYCGEINIEDATTKEITTKIKNNEFEHLRFFGSDEIRAQQYLFHPFYIEHLDEILALKECAEKKANNHHKEVEKLIANKADEKKCSQEISP